MKDKPQAAARRQSKRKEMLNKAAQSATPSFETWAKLETAVKNGVKVVLNDT